MGMAEFSPSAKCPDCHLIMYLGNQCPHCGHLLSYSEQETQKKFWVRVRNKGYIYGFVFFTSSLIFFSLLFS